MRISVSKSPNPFDQADQNHFLSRTVSFEDLPEIITTKSWSPVVWKGGHRTFSSFEEASLIALDFDNGLWGVKDVVSYLDEISAAYIIGTTRSHLKPKGQSGKSCERFRVVIKASCTGFLRSYQHAYKLLRTSINHDYAATHGLDPMAQKVEVIDPTCSSAARFFYPCAEIVHAVFDGLPWVLRAPEHDEDDETEAIRRWRAEQARIKGRAEYLPGKIAALTQAKEGGRNTALYALSAYMFDAGFDASGIMDYLKLTRSPILGLSPREVRATIKNAERYRARHGEIVSFPADKPPPIQKGTGTLEYQSL